MLGGMGRYGEIHAPPKLAFIESGLGADTSKGIHPDALPGDGQPGAGRNEELGRGVRAAKELAACDTPIQ